MSTAKHEALTAFVFDCSIGGTTRVKVLAPTEYFARELAASMVIDDFENAGLLKLGDVDMKDRPADDTGIDSSIRWTGPGAYEYAKDDPNGLGEV